MPVLIINGEIPGPDKRSRKTCLCEWCGYPLTADTCCTVSQTWEGAGRPEVAVMTRMCQACLRMYTNLGKDRVTGPDGPAHL